MEIVSIKNNFSVKDEFWYEWILLDQRISKRKD